MVQATYRYYYLSILLVLLMAMTACRAYGCMLTAGLLQSLLGIGAAVTLFLVGLNVWHKRFGHAASIATAPIALALIVISANLFEISPSKIRFIIMRHEYVAELPQAGNSSNLQIKVWPWNWYVNGLILGGQTFEFLIYDSSDQITQGPRTQTDEWSRSAKAAGYKVDCLDGFVWLATTNLGGHFYIIAGAW